VILDPAADMVPPPTMRPLISWAILAVFVGGVTGAYGAPRVRPHEPGAKETEDELVDEPEKQPDDQLDHQPDEEARVPAPSPAPSALPSSGPASPVSPVAPAEPIQ